MNDHPVALVTGASGGIGGACAVALAQAGCDVAVGYSTTEQEAHAVATRCRNEDVQAAAFRADVADDDACRRLINAVAERFGRLDILVNNAGMTKIVPGDPLEEISEADFDRLFQVNVRSAFQLCRAVAPSLRASRGAIVNVSSHSGHSGFGSSMVYAATKGALNTLTLGLARQLAPEIRVNAVCPGFVATKWLQKARGLDDEQLAQLNERVRRATPLHRVTSPEDVAEAVVWLAVRASAVTGQLLVIDGGAHLTVMDPIKSAQTP